MCNPYRIISIPLPSGATRHMLSDARFPHHPLVEIKSWEPAPTEWTYMCATLNSFVVCNPQMRGCELIAYK